MFSTLHNSTRAALLTVLVTGSALVVPTAAGAQSVTPERALLNRLQATPTGTVIALTQGNARPAPVEPAFVDGERALLNRFHAPRAPLIADPEPREAVFAMPVPDGVRALLNRPTL